MHGMIFARFDKFPDSKIGNMVFFFGVVNSGASFEILKVEAGEVGVGWELGGVEIDAICSFVGEAALCKSVDKGLGFGDIIGGACPSGRF